MGIENAVDDFGSSGTSHHHGSLTGFVLVIFTILISMTPLVRDRTWKNLEALDINIKYCIVDRYYYLDIYSPAIERVGPRLKVFFTNDKRDMRKSKVASYMDTITLHCYYLLFLSNTSKLACLIYHSLQYSTLRTKAVTA